MGCGPEQPVYERRSSDNYVMVLIRRFPLHSEQGQGSCFERVEL
jgi:hypothetical protein